MQSWKFFKKPDDEQEETPKSVSLADKYPLYAITNKKKYAKRFMKERNMNRFFVTKAELDQDEYSEYANRHRGAVLDIYKYLTAKNKHSTYPDKSDVELLTTMNEKQMVEESTINIFDNGFWEFHKPTTPFAYNNEILEAMKILDFVSCYKLYTQPDYMMEESDDYDAPSGYIDEFEFFIDVFKDLFL